MNKKFQKTGYVPKQETLSDTYDIAVQEVPLSTKKIIDMYQALLTMEEAAEEDVYIGGKGQVQRRRISVEITVEDLDPLSRRKR